MSSKYKPGGPLEIVVLAISAAVIIAGAICTALHIISADTYTTEVLPEAGALPVLFGVPKAISLGKLGKFSLDGLIGDVPELERLTASLNSKNWIGAISILESLVPSGLPGGSSPSGAETRGAPAEPTVLSDHLADVELDTKHDQSNTPPPSAEDIAAAKALLERAGQS